MYKYFPLTLFLIFSGIIFSIFINLSNYEESFQFFSNSTLSLSKNNTLLKLYKIENEIKIAIQNIPININYTIGHVQKANKLVDADFVKGLMSLQPRVVNQIQSHVYNLKNIVNSSSVPMLVKGTQISEGLSHIVDLVQLLEVSKIENDTKISQTLESFFYLLNNDILKSYNDSTIWLNNQTKIKNNDTKSINQINTINSSNYRKSLEFQTAQGFAAGVSEFIDNLMQLTPDAFKNYNTTKIKNDYNTLNQLINNKTNISKIVKFNNQYLSNVI
jgi:hypothetical protein